MYANMTQLTYVPTCSVYLRVFFVRIVHDLSSSLSHVYFVVTELLELIISVY